MGCSLSVSALRIGENELGRKAREECRTPSARRPSHFLAWRSIDARPTNYRFPDYAVGSSSRSARTMQTGCCEMGFFQSSLSLFIRRYLMTARVAQRRRSRSPTRWCDVLRALRVRFTLRALRFTHRAALFNRSVEGNAIKNETSLCASVFLW